MAGQQQRFGAISKGCLYILIALVGGSLFYQMVDLPLKAEITKFAAASGQSLWLDLKVWQLITSPFLEVEFIGLIFQGFMLYMFIPNLERWWGTKRFLKFAAYTTMVGIAVGTLVAVLIPGIPDMSIISGLDPLIYASIVAYGTLFANQPVSFFGVIPMTGRQLTIGICGFMLFFVILTQNWAEGASYVSAMLVAWLLTNGNWTPKIWLLKRKQARLRAHLKVVRDDEDKPKTKWLN